MRYVHDPRRRRQLLLVRRFITGFLMVVVVALGFISEFSSLATFAGFLTAGLAVALQTVILSVAAYFFLVGRYGVRVGDRITVGGVTGDVIEVGLVRLYLMELAGTGIDLYPTGRAVLFSNSVLFQASPLFKQIPGTAYAWHEVAISLAQEADPGHMEKLLLEAVQSVYKQYESSILRQYRTVEQLIDASLPPPTPHSQLRFGETGLEFVVRYPVEIQRSSEIDDLVTRKLLETIGTTPEIKKDVAGVPRLRAAIRA
jgi:small-conductance mechanosensitive channel